MSTNEVVIVIGILINFVGTLFAIFRAQLKTENRLTKMETMVGMMVRECAPPNFKHRSGDGHLGLTP